MTTQVYERAAHGRYGLAQLEELPTLCEGQADNLKIETETMRVWLCRCGVADGLAYENMVTIEVLIDGYWQEVDQYQAL